MGPPQPPSLDLPKPPADLRASRKGDKVTITWTIPNVTTDKKTAKSLGQTCICRGLEPALKQCGTPVGEAAPPANPTSAKTSKQKITASYTDSLPSQMESDDPSRLITYAIEVLNRDGRGAGLSNQVRVSLIRTLPPPQDFRAQVTDQGVVLTWTSEIPTERPPVSYVYRVFRRAEETPQQTLVGELPAGSDHNLTVTDTSFEWEKTYEYRAETVTVIAEKDKPPLQIEGDDTAEIKIFAHDIFPPAVPSGLQAVFSGPGQKAFIDLIWAPVSDIDLDGYNIYRHEEGSAPVKLNAEPLKTPAYRDADVVPGKRYIYSVSAIDVRGNESARSQEASESVP